MLFGPAFGLSAVLLLFGLNAVLRTYGANREVFLPAQHVIIVMVAVLGPIIVLAMRWMLSSSESRTIRRPRAAASPDCRMRSGSIWPSPGARWWFRSYWPHSDAGFTSPRTRRW